MTLCGVHDNMHVHTTVAHTCDYPLYLYRHTYTYTYTHIHTRNTYISLYINIHIYIYVSRFSSLPFKLNFVSKYSGISCVICLCQNNISLHMCTLSRHCHVEQPSKRRIPPFGGSLCTEKRHQGCLPTFL